MTFKQEAKNWADVSDFFLGLGIKVEMDYIDGTISKYERNKKLKSIKNDWNKSMIANNPFIKRFNISRDSVNKIFNQENG